MVAATVQLWGRASPPMAAPSPGPRSGATAGRSSAAEAELAGLDGEWRREYRQYVAQKDSPSTAQDDLSPRLP